MVHFKKIMVCLDLSDLDEVLIQYAHAFMNSLQAESLIFIHIYQKHQSNILFGKSKKDPDLKSADALYIEIKNKLNNLLEKATFSWNIDIMEGDINETMLEATKKHDADLMIMGRKQELENSEGLPKKTVKKSECSVLLIPEAPYREIKIVLVPVDFSQHSAVAVKLALLLLGNEGQIHCQHVYEVPSGYHRTGKDYYEFAKVMEGNAVKDTKDFIKKYNLPEEKLKFIYILDEKGRPAKEVIKYSKKIGASLISMGSKGRTEAASFLLGSVAEDIVTLNDIIPLLVVKKKNENLDFFDVILQM